MILRKLTQRKLATTFIISLIIIIGHFSADLLGFGDDTLLGNADYPHQATSQKVIIIKIDDETIKANEFANVSLLYYAKMINVISRHNPKVIAISDNLNHRNNALNLSALSKAIRLSNVNIVLATHNIVSKYKNVTLAPPSSLSENVILADATLMRNEAGIIQNYPIYGVNGKLSFAALLSGKNNLPSQPIRFNLNLDFTDIQHISMIDVLNNRFDPAIFRNKTVFVGNVSQHYGRSFSVGMTKRVSEVALHAMAYESIISSQLIWQIDPHLLLFIAILLFTILSMWHDDRKLMRTLGINFGLCLVIFVGNYILHNYYSIWFEPKMLYIILGISLVLEAINHNGYHHYIVNKQSDRDNFNQALINQVLKVSNNGIIITNIKGTILVANDKARLIFSMDTEDLRKSQQVFRYISGSESLLEMVENLNSLQISQLETITQSFCNKQGENYTVDLKLLKSEFIHAKDINTKQAFPIYTFTISDITDKVEMIVKNNRSEVALINMRDHDALTKLHNRHSFNNHLDTIFLKNKSRKKHFIMLINMDGIKEINEMYGSKFGDKLICQIGQRLKKVAVDRAFVARYTDKIFGIIYDEEDETQYNDIINKISDTMGRHFSIGGVNILMPTSIGIAIAPQHGENSEALISNAMQALDFTRSTVMHKWYIYEEGLEKRIKPKRQIKQEIQRAIKNEEFVLYYQPQHDIRSGELVGYESLIRWNDPLKGLRFPDEFIPVAEEYGLMAEIGELVLKLGCHDAANWPIHLSVAINVSASQFQSLDMAALCLKYLEQSGLQANRLELEITESMMMDDIDTIIQTLCDIKSQGVKIVMDDFGTGYSSLQYLTEIPFDKIKIDRSFTMNIGKSQQSDAIISTIVALGHALDKTVLAEGIETPDMITLLGAAGCQIGQGYYYGKPMPLNDVYKQLTALYPKYEIA